MSGNSFEWFSYTHCMKHMLEIIFHFIVSELHHLTAENEKVGNERVAGIDLRFPFCTKT